jgi:poly(beta-D-mannuronate) C5 epimerase
LPKVRPSRLLLVPAALLWAWPALAESPRAEVAVWLAERDRALAGIGVAVPETPVEEVAPVAPAPSLGSPLQVVGSDVRLALTQMAMVVGSAGRTRIEVAQTPGDVGAIYVRSGSGTLAELYEATRGGPLEGALRREGRAYVAVRPIVVVQGAALTLGSGEVLELEGQSGAFLLSFGELAITGATVRAKAPDPEAEDPFRPFVASLGTGRIEVTDSLFQGLGSDIAPAASGLALASGSLFAPVGASSVRDSRFEDVQGLSVLGGVGVAVEGNRFERPRGVAIWTDGADDVEVRGNLVVGAEGPFALRLDGPATDLRVAGNVLVGGRHAGVRIADGAEGADLTGNVVTGFAGRAVVAEEGARCLRLSGNLIRDNGGDGVSTRDAGDVIVAGNVLTGNGGAGVSLVRPQTGAALLVADNLISDNRSGVRASGVEALRLSGNDLAGQMPRHLAGDLAQHTPLLLRESRGGGRASLLFQQVRAETMAPLVPEAADDAFSSCRVEARS